MRHLFGLMEPSTFRWHIPIDTRYCSLTVIPDGRHGSRHDGGEEAPWAGGVIGVEKNRFYAKPVDNFHGQLGIPILVLIKHDLMRLNRQAVNTGDADGRSPREAAPKSGLGFKSLPNNIIIKEKPIKSTDAGPQNSLLFESEDSRQPNKRLRTFGQKKSS